MGKVDRNRARHPGYCGFHRHGHDLSFHFPFLKTELHNKKLLMTVDGLIDTVDGLIDRTRQFVWEKNKKTTCLLTLKHKSVLSFYL